jgi:hypothetical protein
MIGRAKAFARELNRSSGTLEERVDTAYGLAFGRPPTAEEARSAVEFLQKHPAKDTDALTDLCHVMLNSSEFLYVD